MKRPATVFPRVTGMRLEVMKWPKETGAPAEMPMGMRNMFATECSRPRATKADMGNQTPTAFPARLVAAEACQTPMQTRKLQRTPREKASIQVRDVFATASLVMGCVGPNIPA
jgi:hypothetical protein